MTKEILEPFLILPYGNMQDMIWFINKQIEKQYVFLIDLAYKKISNEILHDNLIRVVNRLNEIIIFHIYPTSYKEKDSNRIGQNLIIGYIINKSCFRRKKFNNLVCACALFFESIAQCGYIEDDNLSIPTKFLYKVNLQYYNEYIRKYLNQTRKQMALIMKNDKCIMIIKTNERLNVVYNFIKSKLVLFREYWILIDETGGSYNRVKSRVYTIVLRG